MSGCTAEALLALARSQLGVKESPAGSNAVKYNAAYYGRAVSGPSYPWCCVFLWWLFHTLGADGLFYGGQKTAYCPALLTYHRAQRVTDYQPGDVIFFNFSGRGTAAHVGLCERRDGRRITTIDGNTGAASEANGGAVMRRTRDVKYVVGAYRPAYAAGGTPPVAASGGDSPLGEGTCAAGVSAAAPQAGDGSEEGEIDVTEQDVRRIVREELDKAERERAARPASPWARVEEAKAAGITDGARPGSFATREEVATMLVNAGEAR